MAYPCWSLPTICSLVVIELIFFSVGAALTRIVDSGVIYPTICDSAVGLSNTFAWPEEGAHDLSFPEKTKLRFIAVTAGQVCTNGFNAVAN